ncbi:MAG: antitoxin [Candidatus Neomarinimicrobiota bacterium]|nr:MAG: antitoxin [Candidatus Neomarinimicrobiota bacterium]
MNAKLTLRMDKKLIEVAKAYSKKTGKSISRIVADLFEVVKTEKLPEENQVTPTVSSLRGVLKGAKVDEADYRKYLEDEHL